MYCDIRDEQRLAKLRDIVLELSRDPDPVRSVNRYSEHMREIYGDQGMISVSLRGVPRGHYRVMRLLHASSVVDEHYRIVPFAGADAPVHSGGLIGDIIAWERPTVIRDLGVPSDPVLGDQLAPYRLFVALPVYFEGAITNWVIFLHRRSDAFTSEGIEARFMQANLLGNLTNAKRVAKELHEAMAWIHREIDEIAAIQRGLLPQRLPDIPGVRVAASYATFDRAGGDYYDLFPAEDGRWWIVVADASGHGPSAAVVTAMLSVLLHSLPANGSAGALLDAVNRHLMRRAVNGSFVTAFLGLLDPHARQIDYACAGHPLPLRRSNGGGISAFQKPCDGLPLGVMGSAGYPECRAVLERGDELLLFTDGLTEAMAPNRETFGEARLREAFSEVTPEPEATLQRLLHLLHQHQSDARPEDDQTALILRFV